MGRIEQPVDPTAGPLQSFAHDLQILRRKAGEPPYRTMGRRVGVSYSTLSQAAKGQQLPTLAVTLAFVRCCGGNVDDECHWRQRWEQVRSELSRRAEPAVDDSPVSVRASPGAGDRSDPVRILRVAAAIAIATTVLGSAVAAGTFINRNVSVNAAAGPAGRAVIHRIADGQDPYINGCGHDEQPLERQPIYFKSGKFYGWIVLFYSSACSAAWGYVLGPNSASLRVFISAHRITDNTIAPSSFQGDARPNSWGNALSTRTGCVRAEAWVDNGPHAITSCWRPDGPVER